MRSMAYSSVSLTYSYLLVNPLHLPYRFMVSKDGTHGSSVVFSDAEVWGKMRSVINSKLNEHNTQTEFRKVIYDSPYFGYQTRIDLAFDMATKEVFVQKNGMFLLFIFCPYCVRIWNNSKHGIVKSNSSKYLEKKRLKMKYE